MIEILQEDVRKSHLVRMKHSGRSTKNLVPIIPESEDTSEGSGRVIDKLLSKLEENVNVVEKETQLTGSVTESTTSVYTFGERITDAPDMHTKERSQTKTELSQLYDMFFRLSSKISNIEKTLLEKQKEQFRNELRQMQHNFLNFTKHILTMQVTQYGVVNSSLPSLNEIKHINELIKNHAARLDSIEDIVMDHKMINRDKIHDITGDLYNLQQLLTDFRGTSHKHRHTATGMFQKLGATMEDYAVKIKRNDDRLAHLEVRVLNASLQRCEKSNKDIIQDLKITNLENSQVVERGRVRYNEQSIDR